MPSAAHDVAALGQRLHMADAVLMSPSVAPFSRQQLVIHPLEMLGDDVQAGFRHQVMDVGDAAGHRVLDRHHGEARLAVAHRREHVLEGSGRAGSACPGKRARQARLE